MDSTTIWAFWQRHKRQTGAAIVGLLLFAAGWQTGRVMSPYYAAHPIVFEEGVIPSGGTAEELNALVQPAAPSPAPQVSSAPVEAEGEVAAATDAAEKRFVGSINSDLFHDPTCPSAGRIKEANQIWFSSVAEAQRLGYSPSQCAQEKLGL